MLLEELVINAVEPLIVPLVVQLTNVKPVQLVLIFMILLVSENVHMDFMPLTTNVLNVKKIITVKLVPTHKFVNLVTKDIT